MSWIKVEDRLPVKEKKYPVIVDCDGVLQESYCTFKVKQNRFHFDITHIRWKVVAWYDLPEYDPDAIEKNCNMQPVCVSLLEEAATLVGNPGTNISGSCDVACMEWQEKYKRWCNERRR